jgi:hypothetical protein
MAKGTSEPKSAENLANPQEKIRIMNDFPLSRHCEKIKKLIKSKD